MSSVTALQALQRYNPSTRQPYAQGPTGRDDTRLGLAPARVLGGEPPFAPRVILGAPGAGKTRRLIECLGEELRAGVRPQEIAYVSFSRAATTEARARAQCAERLWDRETPWFRTIHSTALCVLDHSAKLLVIDDVWREFGERYSYAFSNCDDEREDVAHRPLPCQTADDLLRFAYDWGRNCRLSLDKTLSRFPTAGLVPGVLRTYVKRFERFKTEHGLRDFVDLLEDALLCEVRPPVLVAFVDEAQDLSPLQIALVEKWFATCVRVYVAGDDDQAIYVHNGADPAWLRGLVTRCPVERLTHSHRMPETILAYAARLIGRNKHRVPKELSGQATGGEIRYLDRSKATELVDGSRETFVLARNRVFLAPFAKELIARAVPFIVEGKGAPSPLSEARLVRAVRAGCALHADANASVEALDLAAILRFVRRDSDLRPRGVLRRLESIKNARRRLFYSDIVGEFGLRALLEFIRTDGPLAPIQTIAPWKRQYLRALLDVHGVLPVPKVTLTSIHASKGKEAQLVVVLSDVSKSTFREYRRGGVRGYESENRVFYVAVTRAQETLVIVDARSRRAYDFPPRPDSSLTHARERWEERSAILEYDAGFERAVAEERAVGGARGA